MKSDHLELLEKDLKQISSTSMGRRLFLQSAPLLLAGCSVTQVKKHRFREGDNKGQEVHITPSEEMQLNRAYRPKLLRDYPPFNDDQVQRYVKSLGQKIISRSGLDGNPYRYQFLVVDAKMVNAFALPAGDVFVTAPLIKMAKNEAELAGVIGHEIGHIKARHTAERMARAQKEKWNQILGATLGGLLGGAAGFGLGKIICSKSDKECLKRITFYGGVAGVGGGLLIRKYAFMAHSREDEMEADRIGFRVAYQGGFHKDYIGDFYSRLYTMEQEYRKKQNPLLAPFADAMSTHPPAKERVVQMNEMAQNTSLKGRKINSPTFEAIKKRV